MSSVEHPPGLPGAPSSSAALWLPASSRDRAAEIVRQARGMDSWEAGASQFRRQRRSRQRAGRGARTVPGRPS